MEPLKHFSRRTLLKSAGFGGVSWLTSAAHLLAHAAERDRSGQPAQSLIVLWMQGGPSQLETWDPHPGTLTGGQTTAIPTAAGGIQLANGLEQVAEQMEHISIVRSLVSKEGDHERGTYLLKTGYRPDPTTVHPSIGAICCHELPQGKTEIPRHISILANSWAMRGGFLGDQYDAFRAGDPANRVPDVLSPIDDKRYRERLRKLDLLEQTFAGGRGRLAAETQHRDAIRRARLMMTSDQIKAFDVSLEPQAVRNAFGDTPFGRGCLAARRLIEQGVRCVEVTLAGWDTHADNYQGCLKQKRILDPALAALIADLKGRDLLDRTIVLCAGEFGRTPRMNALDGRDHWPGGFSVALAGGGLRGGVAIGATDPAGGASVKEPHPIADLHATILTALGLDPVRENLSPIGRPIKLSEGTAIGALIG
jgi:hypothetical protein